MNEIFKNYLQNNLYFWVFSIIAVLLIIASFILPPLGVIDPSVALAVGEVFAFAALGTVVKAIDAGKTATVQHGQTTITIGKDIDEVDLLQQDNIIEESAD